MNAPYRQNDEARTRDALWSIPANCDHDYWVKIGMAIKSEYGDGGFDMFDAWSQQADSYNAASAKSTWKGITPIGGITLGTLFYEAKRHGWSDAGQETEVVILMPEELQARDRERAAREAQDQADKKRRHKDAARKAHALWDAGVPAADDHPYLVRKQIKSVGYLKEMPADQVTAILSYQPKSGEQHLSGRVLIAPVLFDNDLTTAELIDEHGLKSAIYGGAKAGGFWQAQEMPEGDGTGTTILIAEGVATAMSAREATGHLAVAALSNGQLKTVAQTMRSRYPAAIVVILADLQKATGEADPKAIEAALSTGALLAVPDFAADRPDGATDFNDMAQHCGLEAVQRALAAAAHLGRCGDGSVPGNAPAIDLTSIAGSEGFEGSQGARSGNHVEVTWLDPLPIPSGLLPVEPFTAELLPESVRESVMDIADRMQCPPDFPAVAAMVGLSSVIGRKACIRPKRQDNWEVIPNLWGVVVGRPGVMKSPALSEALKPLDRLAATANAAHAKAMQDHELKTRIQEMTTKSAEVKAQKLVAGGKTGEAERALAEACESDDIGPPPHRRYKVTDATVEALGEILMGNPWGTLAYRDELHGLLRSLDKDGQEGSRSFYLQGYDGNQEYVFDRIIRGHRRIPALCISMLGGIQPGKLQAYLRDAMTGGAGDDGLLQRFGMLVWPDVSAKWRNVDRWPDTAAKTRAFETFQRLDSLASSVDVETGEGCPAVHRFAPGAQDMFEVWRNEFELELRSGAHHPAVESHLAKYRKLVPAIALVCALADGETEVSESSMARALGWSEYLRSHAMRAYAAGSKPATSGAVALLAKIQARAVVDGFSAREVSQKEWSSLSTAVEAQAAVQMLSELHYLRAVERPSGSLGGRPTVGYLINPAVRRAG